MHAWLDCLYLNKFANNNSVLAALNGSRAVTKACRLILLLLFKRVITVQTRDGVSGRYVEQYIQIYVESSKILQLSLIYYTHRVVFHVNLRNTSYICTMVRLCTSRYACVYSHLQRILIIFTFPLNQASVLLIHTKLIFGGKRPYNLIINFKGEKLFFHICDTFP